jgi:hypothetical protein
MSYVCSAFVFNGEVPRFLALGFVARRRDGTGQDDDDDDGDVRPASQARRREEFQHARKVVSKKLLWAVDELYKSVVNA